MSIRSLTTQCRDGHGSGPDPDPAPVGPFPIGDRNSLHRPRIELLIRVTVHHTPGRVGSRMGVTVHRTPGDVSILYGCHRAQHK